MSDCENIIKVNGLSKAYSRDKPPVYAVYHAEFAIRGNIRAGWRVRLREKHAGQIASPVGEADQGDNLL